MTPPAQQLCFAIVFSVLCSLVPAAPATGPLRVHPTNPRYFTDGTKMPDGSPRAVYLTGSHTWANLVDMAKENPPAPFDYERYLEFLERHGHNFFRLWAWEPVVWDTRANGPEISKDFVHHVAPLPWLRTGPGRALDGGPKFDLTKFDPLYFERLRNRSVAAGRRGIYVSVMLFEGWGLMHGDKRRGVPRGWWWRGHPFHPENNINGLRVALNSDDNGRVHSLASPDANTIQAAYIRKVVETVNDLDNILYEVINEGGEQEWDWWVLNKVRRLEADMPKQHPIGLTGHGAEDLKTMLASTADWTSPGSKDGFRDDPPAWDEKKVSLLDTDHVWGIGGHAAWVWKSFLRGHNPIFMDPYDSTILGSSELEPRWESVRRAMGATRLIAGRLGNLAAMTPQPMLASTEYCLANPGVEYLIYQPKPGEHFSVELPAGSYRAEWFDPQRDSFETVASFVVRGGRRRFTANFDGVAVLHIVSEKRPAQ